MVSCLESALVTLLLLPPNTRSKKLFNQKVSQKFSKMRWCTILLIRQHFHSNFRDFQYSNQWINSISVICFNRILSIYFSLKMRFSISPKVHIMFVDGSIQNKCIFIVGANIINEVLIVYYTLSHLLIIFVKFLYQLYFKSMELSLLSIL